MFNLVFGNDEYVLDIIDEQPLAYIRPVSMKVS